MTSACALFGVLGLLSLGITGCAGADTKAAPMILSGRLDVPEGETGAITPHVMGGAREGAEGDPAVVSVLTGGGLCTGTLIAPRFVLTAQHCVEGHDRLAVTFGSRSRQGRRITARPHVPPRTVGHTSDIAVLELSEPSAVRPVPVNLRSQGLAGLSEIRVVGYGVTGTFNSDSGIKRTGNVRATVTRSYVESAGGGDGTCFGDSGGPALALIDGREQLVAVTSHGTSRRCEDGRGRYVRTDAHRDFLSQFVVGGGAGTAPAPSEAPGRGRPGLGLPVLPDPPAPVFEPFPVGVSGGSNVRGDERTVLTTARGVTVIMTTSADGSVRIEAVR